MAEKKTPAPIDRPLSRAYLREFSGWSTAYPPGLSDPTSLRIMENVMINRDGSARVRPGMRYLSYASLPVGELPGSRITHNVLGSHEPFFLNDGSKAYLFAVREDDLSVGFRVLTFDADSSQVRTLDSSSLGFLVDEDINFSEATTYVKYLQIDNKIFALSNAGESMRMFSVGEVKRAQVLSAITRPDWAVADKLTVVQPDGPWITDGVILGTRTNLIPNPSFESNLNTWTSSAYMNMARIVAPVTAPSGTRCARLMSNPQRTNLMIQPLHALSTTGLGVWRAESNTQSVDIVSNYLHWTMSGSNNSERRGYVVGPSVAVVAGRSYRAAADWGNLTSGGQPNAGFGYRFRWYNSAGTTIRVDDKAYGTITGTVGRRSPAALVAPAGAVRLLVMPFIRRPPVPRDGGTFASNGYIRNMVVHEADESGTMFTGSSGTNYFWTGTVNNSTSVYHPPVSVVSYSPRFSVTAGETYAASVYALNNGTARASHMYVRWFNSAGTLLLSEPVSTDPDTGSWVRRTALLTAPAGAVTADVYVGVPSLPRNEQHYVDAVMVEKSDSLQDYFDGSTVQTATLKYRWAGTAHASASIETEYAQGGTIPNPETPTATTLISNDATENIFNFGFFYTFSNEVGESAASQITVVRTMRPWVGWLWKDAAGVNVNDPVVAADQLVAIVPEEAYDQALAEGAIALNLYMMTWSDQDSIPVMAMRVQRKELTPGMPYGEGGWARATPQMSDTSEYQVGLPNANNRYNYSDPSKGGQGVVAADRMIMVYDPTAAAVVRWSSNQQGDYTNFTAGVGGGYKTLTSGNLNVPAVVKLWQNPQSVDTLTVLCLGVDGRNSAYYMAPASVTSQSESVSIMGFEETTATPGTTSPYGCEVFNNTLYHPLDEQLMKSTASNYNINHKSMTDAIRDSWFSLATKEHIVSSEHDGRLYYVVNNPQGEPLEEGCWGNEIWVLDVGAEGGTWSRWLVQAQSLRRIERNGLIYMSVVRPDGIYYFDDLYDQDDYVGLLDIPPIWADNAVLSRNIGWKLETNTQGANRAHDAWALLQQVGLVVGNFQGYMRWGVRGWDQHGRPIDVSKELHQLDLVDLSAGIEPSDLEDMLLVQAGMKEWFFYAESVLDEDDQPKYSFGQLNLVQYRYAPLSVNIGYGFGSVETFEYGRARDNWVDRTTDNGIPTPFIDTRRP